MTQDITDLEQRIAAAFDRMDRGLETLARDKNERGKSSLSQTQSDVVTAIDAPETAADAPPHMAAVMRALETAKAQAADWAERYTNLQSQSSEETLAMAGEISRLTAELESARSAPLAAPNRDAEIDELTARLAAQEAELETLRAARAADASELGELIAQLAPLVEEASHV